MAAPRPADSLVDEVVALRPAAASGSSSSSSSADSAVHVNHPIELAMDARQADPQASPYVWVDFMVYASQTELDPNDHHRFDDDLLLFLGFLAGRRLTTDEAPVREIMRTYHQRLPHPEARAFWDFLQIAAKP